MYKKIVERTRSARPKKKGCKEIFNKYSKRELCGRGKRKKTVTNGS